MDGFINIRSIAHYPTRMSVLCQGLTPCPSFGDGQTLQQTLDIDPGTLQGQLGNPEPGEHVGVVRSPYPPHDFECLYRNSCPYLEGLSTQWVLEEVRRADDVYQEHLRIIEAFDGDLKARDERIRILERENVELKARLQALHRRQFRLNKKKEAQTGGEVEGASSSNEAQKKKRGAPLGHPGWVRPKPDHIDRTVHVPAPRICPHCQSEELRPMEESTEHFQEDIVIRVGDNREGAKSNRGGSL